MSPINKIEIVTYLSNRDKLLSEIIYLTKPVFKTKQADDEFTSLIKTVIGQQLSGSAAKTIISRVEKIFSSKKFYPNKINSTDDHLFRKCGMSYSKINYIKGIARLVNNEKDYFNVLKRMTDSEVINTLCAIKGIGIWTASIFAMGSLKRENIFAYGDGTLNKAIRTIYGESVELETIIANWSPYKTFACRVLWQWVDKGMPQKN